MPTPLTGLLPEGVIDIREFKKNNQKKTMRVISTAEMTFEANQQYYVCDVPDNILVTNRLFIATDQVTNGGVSANPTTANLKYVDDDGNLQALENKFYSNAKHIVFDVGATEWSGVLMFSYMEAGITSGFYS